jgi:hypothetical protein
VGVSIDLQRFCASDLDSREYLRKPWRAGEWVYATNGHFAVRVPAADFPDVAEEPKAPNKVSALFDAHSQPGEWLSLPQVPALRACLSCGGKRFQFAVKCEDCDEEGEFKHGDHYYACKNCEDSLRGPGWLSAAESEPGATRRGCDACYGFGYRHGSDVGYAFIGGISYDEAYVAFLAAHLPNARIRPGSDAGVTPAVPAVLTFDGGQALLMPRRVD